MSGYYRNSLDVTVGEVRELWSDGIENRAAIHQIKKLKDNTAGRPGTATVRCKAEYPRDQRSRTGHVCDDGCRPRPYSSHGHDGIVENGQIVNDPTGGGPGADEYQPRRSRRRYGGAERYDGRIGAIRKAWRK